MHVDAVLKLEFTESSKLRRVIAAEGYLNVILHLHSYDIFTVHFLFFFKKKIGLEAWLRLVPGHCDLGASLRQHPSVHIEQTGQCRVPVKRTWNLRSRHRYASSGNY